MGESERLREALINLERARDREQELHLESEGLLAGLQVLVTSQTTAEIFDGLLEVFRTALSFEEAFILTARADETMTPVASTAVQFADSLWRPQALFKRVIEGQPTAVFDVEQVGEWQDQPEHVRAAVRSALHIPLRGGPRPVMLICTHTERGYFGHKHIKLGQRFAPLASQALLNIELQRAIVERDRLFTLSFDLMCIVGFDGRFKQLNPAWEKALGFAMDELKAKPLLECVHPEDQAATGAALQKLMTGAAVSFENRCVCQDGSYKWLLWSATGRTEERLLYAVARDITERKQVEAQRQASIRFLESLERVNQATQQASDVEQMLRDAIEAVYSIFDCDRAWLLYPCDPEAPTFRIPVEYVRPGYPGAFALDLDVPMKPGADRVCAAALASEDPVVYGPGTDRAVYKELVDQFGVLSQIIMALYPKVGRPWMFGMHQCSHARVWTEDEQRLFKEISQRVGDALSTLLLLRDLRESEERFDLAVQGSGEGLWDWPDIEQEEQWWSPRRYEMLGYEPGEIESSISTWLALLHPDDRDKAFAAMQEHFQTRRPYNVEYRLRHKAGRYVWVQSRGQSIWDESGQVRRMSGSHQDVTERKRAEEGQRKALAEALQATHALRESEEKYRNLVDTISDLVYTVDVAGNILFVNPAAKQFTGRGPEEAIGHNFAEYVHPDDASVLLAAVQQALSGVPLENIEGLGQDRDIKHRMIRGDGEVIWVASRGALIKDNQGDIVGFTGVSRNITEQVRAEEQLRRLKEFNEGIVQNMTEGIVLQDAQGCLTFVNPAAAALLGYAPAEMEGLHWTAIIPPDQHPIVVAADERRVRGESDRYELELVRKDGERIFVLVSGSPRFEEGRFVGTMAVFADITERKRAEEGQRKALAEALQATHALRESEARLRVLIDHLPAEVWAMDDDLYFIIQNAASARIVGNVVGKRIEDLDVPPEVKARWIEQDRHVLDGNILCEEYQIEVEGEQKAYENIVAPVRVGDAIVGLVGVALDVTERKRAEEELEEHREHLEELVKERTAELVVAKEQAEAAQSAAEAANRAKSAFLASMSHELRTPLNAILGYAQICKRQPLDPEIINGLNVIERSGEHLLILINDILTISRIETGRMELYPGLIHFPTFLADIASIVHPRAATKRLTFDLEKLNTLPTWVQADETRLRQVLFNLLDNAIKFTDEGQVTLRVKCESHLPAASPSAAAGPALSTAKGTHPVLRFTFEVQDSGSGIAPDQLERIFQPFEQAEDVTRWIKGPGLGLPISRQLVRLMGGELHVQSEPGRGSTFWFEVALPVSEEMVEEVQLPDRIITGYKGPRRTVLVVDDVPSNRAVLVELLQPLGFEVVEAADGQQAVHLAQETRPDLILMDRWMPVLDGFEATRWMRQIPELQEVVIIAVSASVSEADQAQSREVGLNAFLPKPVNWPRLAALLEEHLELEWEVEEGEREEVEVLAPVRSLPVEPPPWDLTRAKPPRETAPLVPPPQEELALLLDLARMGDMHAIRERAAHIETLGEQYVPFARKLRELARSFEEREILALVRQYVEESE